MTTPTKLKELIFNFENVKNQLIIGIFLNSIKEDDITTIIERTLIEEMFKVDKGDFDAVDVLNNMKSATDMLKKQIIQELDMIHKYKINYTKIFSENNDKLINKIMKMIHTKYNIIATIEQLAKLYNYFYNDLNTKTKKQIVVSNNTNFKAELLPFPDNKIVKNNKIVDNPNVTKKPILKSVEHLKKCSTPPKIKSKNCNKCNCKRIQLTRTIEYRECSSQSISIYKNRRKTYGYVKLYDCYEDYLGFFRQNGDFLHGIYNSHNSTCECCNNYQITGDLRFNTFTNNYEPHGYAIVKHYNSDNEVIDRFEGEFQYGKHIEDCGNIYDKCANCNKNKPNVVCLKCKKYLCLECDMKIHLPIMKNNNILSHKRNYFDNNIIYQNSRYKIELRQFIIKQSGKLYTIKYHPRTKDVDSLSKSLFSPNVLYYKNETEYKICDKIIELMKTETNDLEMSYKEIKDITESMNFNVQKDTILQ